MIWYLLFALHFFLLACLAVQWRDIPDRSRVFPRPGRLGAGLILLCNALLFYPQLIGYFKLYPVSTPNHFALTLLLWMTTLSGIVLTLLGQLRWATRAGRCSTRALVIMTAVTCLLAGVILRQDMAAGSLLSWWTPVFIVLASAMSYGYWALFMLLAARFNRSGAPFTGQD